MAERVDIAVIGAGLAGICAAATLRAAGFTDFVVLDRGSDVGGTWRDNTYPGCACDVPSALYSFSFEPNPRWSRLFAPQPEIHRYTGAVAERHRVLEHLRLGTEVREAAWDPQAQRWRIATSAGAYDARVLIAGAGPWHAPQIPELPGLDRFAGTAFHSSRWDHDHDLRGRRVAVIGSGASAVQFVPEIQPSVERLHVFQRTPHWVLPKPDRPVPAAAQSLLERVPPLQRALRSGIYHALELLGAAERRPAAMRQLQRIGERHLRSTVADPELRRRLTPDYTLGCKRILLSNAYYPALTRPNVELVPSAVTEVRPDAVVGADGIAREVDTIIFGTGFRILDMPLAEIVRGEDGRTLADVWSGSPRAYLGTTIAGFPNAFVLLGPNLGNGHSSATVLLEYQMAYVIDALRTLERRGLGSVAVHPETQATFNADVDRALAGSIWNAGGCGSYYLDPTGRNGFMYPWSTLRYRRDTRRFDVDNYVQRPPAPLPRPESSAEPVAIAAAQPSRATEPSATPPTIAPSPAAPAPEPDDQDEARLP